MLRAFPAPFRLRRQLDGVGLVVFKPQSRQPPCPGTAWSQRQGQRALRTELGPAGHRAKSFRSASPPSISVTREADAASFFFFFFF